MIDQCKRKSLPAVRSVVAAALLMIPAAAADAQPRERQEERRLERQARQPQRAERAAERVAERQQRKIRVGRAVPTSGCGGGSYDVVVSPDGASISVLFDDFVLNGGEGEQAESCGLSIPLGLPDGYSLGVYQVDYRGYANLGEREAGLLAVDYAVGSRGNSRRFRHRLRGPLDGDFTFTEQLRPGMLRRIGCGSDAKLDLTATLMFRRGEGSDTAMLALDTMDGTRNPAGVTFNFDLQPCKAGPGR